MKLIWISLFGLCLMVSCGGHKKPIRPLKFNATSSLYNIVDMEEATDITPLPLPIKSRPRCVPICNV